MLKQGQKYLLSFHTAINYGLPEEKLFVLESQKPLKVVTSGLLGSDLQEARYLFNHTVSTNYHSSNPLDDIKAIRKRITKEQDVVGLLTAVDVKNTVLETQKDDHLAVATFCTAGVSNGCTAGLPPAENFRNYQPGTINLVIVIDGNLTRGALVNGLLTATEAKVRTLYEYGLRFANGQLLTGTSTDTVTLLCTGQGEEIAYAGTATNVGYFIGSSVYNALWQGLQIYFENKTGKT